MVLAVVSVWAAAPALAQGPAFIAAPTPQAPGLTISVDPAALAAPYATPHASNFAQSLSLPAVPTLAVPAGFAVNLYAQGLSSARNLIVAANGDVFVAEENANRVRLLRDADGDGRAELSVTFSSGFNRPYGLALTAGNLWVADTVAVWRVPFTLGATSGGTRQQVTANGALGDAAGHDTRNLALSPAGDRFYVAIGSRGNIAEEAEPRATIQEFTLNPNGTVVAQRTYASGLRNPVGLAFAPGSSALFTVVNERDGMGDELVPDYLARVVDGGFYGWPYSYMGANVQPNFTPQNPTLAAQRVAAARVPEVPFRSHSAPLGMAFSTGTQFPAEYRGGAFVALHGSWNAAVPRGYMVVYVPFNGASPAGGYQIFASGFWTAGTAKAQVIGRPASVAVAADGALLIADDVSQTVWRVAYAGDATSLIGVFAAGQPAGASFIRLHNASAAAGTVNLLIRNAATGQLLGSWTSPSIAPNASRQFEVAQIAAAASPPATGASMFTIDLRPQFEGSAQHVVWNAGAGMLENLTRCDTAPSPDLTTLINVHSTRLSTYPSAVRIYNAGTTAGAARLALHDAATGGGELSAWQSPVVEPGAMIEVPMATIEAGASPAFFAQPDHYVIRLTGSFAGVLQHVVRNAAGNLADATTRCAIKPD
ncbi:MAG: PQQ-dependent sugar dehydrogenase [Rhodospirillaceae bacterium]|nr:PQQ-dependent sugar dehydrogenase [Rhodospirillaceae bacterium]